MLSPLKKKRVPFLSLLDLYYNSYYYTLYFVNKKKNCGICFLYCYISIYIFSILSLGAQSLKYLLLGPLQKESTNPWLNAMFSTAAAAYFALEPHTVSFTRHFC